MNSKIRFLTLFMTMVLAILVFNSGLLGTVSAVGQETGDVEEPKAKIQSAEGDENKHDYIIGPRDIIRIRVFGAPELATQSRVSGDGTITMPLLGEVAVQGMTTTQVENILARMLEKKYLKNAQVTVFLEEFQSNKVAVIGAVTTPGNYDLIGRETLLQLLSKAGGLNERASDRVVVIRKKESRIIDLEELMMKGTPELNIIIEPGDIINIPHDTYIDIYIFGHVQRPGALRIRQKGKITLLKAIAQAGGFSARAKKSSIIIKRQKDGKEIKLKVNVSKILKGKKPSFILEQDDIIYVSERLF